MKVKSRPQRNLAALSPYMKKGDRHGQTGKAKRSQDKVKLRKEVGLQSGWISAVLNTHFYAGVA